MVRGAALAALSAAAVVTAGAAQPEQVRLAFGDSPSEMAVQFVTLSDATAPAVLFGLSADALNQRAAAESFKFTIDTGRPPWYNHVAKMPGLRPATRYFYRVVVGSDAEGPPSQSQIFHFRSQVHETQTSFPLANHERARSCEIGLAERMLRQDTAATLEASLPQFHVIYGDMGTKCAFTLCSACSCDQYCNASTCAGNHSVGVVSEVSFRLPERENHVASSSTLPCPSPLAAAAAASNIGSEEGAGGSGSRTRAERASRQQSTRWMSTANSHPYMPRPGRALRAGRA